MFWLWFRDLYEMNGFYFVSPYMTGSLTEDTEYIRLCFFWGVATEEYIRDRAKLNLQLEGLRGYSPFEYWRNEAKVIDNKNFVKSRVISEVAWNES